MGPTTSILQALNNPKATVKYSDGFEDSQYEFGMHNTFLHRL